MLRQFPSKHRQDLLRELWRGVRRSAARRRGPLRSTSTLRVEQLEDRVLLSTVKVTTNLNARVGPGTGYLEISDPDYPGYAPAGTVGEVISGPVNANAYNWLKVDYGPGLYSGWSADDWLQKTTSAADQAVQPSSGHLVDRVMSGLSSSSTSVVPAPEAPTPVVPGSMADPGPVLSDGRQTFRWAAVPGATSCGFYLRDVTANTLIEDRTLPASTTTFTRTLVDGHQYRWNMQAFNGSTASPFSQRLYFQIDVPEPTPEAPTLVTPGNAEGPGPALSDAVQIFQWRTVPGATNYGFYLRDVTTNTLIEDRTLPASTTTFTRTLVDGHQYRWNMQAFNGPVASSFSAKLYFQIDVPDPIPETSTLNESNPNNNQQTTEITLFGASPDSTATGFVYPTGRSEPYADNMPGLLSGGPGMPSYWNGYYHVGQDMEAHEGDNVYAIADGEIVYVSTGDWGERNYGLFVKHKLETGQEFLALYGHIRPNCGDIRCSLPGFVSPPIPVSAGKTFATIGPCGSTPHLHFGIYPYTSIPTYNEDLKIGFGRMGINNWPSTNGFVDPVEWITTRLPYSSDVAESLFQITDPPPAAPTLKAPGNAEGPGPALSDAVQTFQWRTVPGATNYGFYLRDVTTNTLIEDRTLPASTTTFTRTLVDGRQYRWNMQAFNGSTASPFSQRLYFQIDVPDFIRKAPALRTPTNDSTEQSTSPEFGSNPNAILDRLQPTGASDETAKQDGLPQRGITGVRASETMAETDYVLVMRFKNAFVEAGRLHSLPPALLAAIASRESRGGGIPPLDEDGYGDGGHGFGLMQIDDRSHPVVRDGGPFGQPHINQATAILRGCLNHVTHTFPSLPKEQQLQMAVSRYNGGCGLSYPDSDQGTTGGDYSNDVLARAEYYAGKENWIETEPVLFPSVQEASTGSGVVDTINAIQKQWLQVTVLVTVNTRLEEPDVFYFGNAIGETGNSTSDAKVNAFDIC